MPIDRYAPLGLWLLIHPGIEAANCVNGQQRLHPNTVAAVMYGRTAVRLTGILSKS